MGHTYLPRCASGDLACVTIGFGFISDPAFTPRCLVHLLFAPVRLGNFVLVCVGGLWGREVENAIRYLYRKAPILASELTHSLPPDGGRISPGDGFLISKSNHSRGKDDGLNENPSGTAARLLAIED